MIIYLAMRNCEENGALVLQAFYKEADAKQFALDRIAEINNTPGNFPVSYGVDFYVEETELTNLEVSA